MSGSVRRQSDLGSQPLEDPEGWLPDQREVVVERLSYYAEFAVEETNYYVGDRIEARQNDPEDTFDPKTAFKSSTGVRPLERQVIQAVKALARRQGSDVLFDAQPTNVQQQIDV
jgi:hypothetical protein